VSDTLALHSIINPNEFDLFKRQTRIIDSEETRKARITIFGLGTIGSNTAMCLAKLGIGKFYIVDYDKVESHNIANQMYSEDDLEKLKTETLRQHMFNFVVRDISVSTHSTKIQEETKFEEFGLINPIMILALDNLHTRKIIWDKIPDRTWVIDGRMSGEKITIFRIKKGSNSEVEKDYLNTFTQKIERGECGRESISYNGYMCASIIGKLTQEIINKTAEDIEVNVDLNNLLMFTNKK